MFIYRPKCAFLILDTHTYTYTVNVHDFCALKTEKHYSDVITQPLSLCGHKGLNSLELTENISVSKQTHSYEP